MRYDQKVQNFFDGICKGLRKKITREELPTLLKEKGVIFREKLFPVETRIHVAGEKRPWWKGGNTADRWETVNQLVPGMELPGLGEIGRFTYLEVGWSQTIEGGKVTYTPTSVYGSYEHPDGGSSGVKIDDGVRKAILSFFFPVEADLPEPLVTMPLPTWQVVWGNCNCGYADGGSDPLTFFRSDAEKLGRDFSREVLSLTGDLQKVQGICENGKAGGDPFGYQQIAEIFTALQQ